MTSGSIAFDRAAEYYDETREFPPGIEKPVAELIAQAGNLSAASRVLEIGIGTGQIALPLAAHLGTLGTLHGVDLSLPMMERLRAKQNGERIHLALGDATRLPYPAGAFDAAVAVHVFHLIPDWQGVIAELRRTLKPGAPLLSGWNEYGHSPFWNIVNTVLPDRRYGARGSAMRTEYETFLSENGWQMERELVHSYTYHQVPQHYIETLRGRMWSLTWEMSDDDLAKAIDAVQGEINRRYADVLQPVEVNASFHVKAYV